MHRDECGNCHGKGRVGHPFSAAAGTRQCEICKGSGKAPALRIHPGGISWHKEDTLGLEPGSGVEIRMGLGGAGAVAVPNRRPFHLIVGIAEGLSLGHTYTIEIPCDDLVLTYTGVPVEEHDCSNDQYIVRLDKALMISARKE